MNIQMVIESLTDIAERSNMGLETKVEIITEAGEIAQEITFVSLEKPDAPIHDICYLGIE